MSERTTSLRDWWSSAWMSVAATAGCAAPHLFSALPDGLGLGEAALAVGLGAATSGGSVLAGRLANIVDRTFCERILDPQALLRNRHLHTLTARAVRVLLEAAAAEEAEFLPSGQQQLRKLASVVEAEWDEFTRLQGFAETLGTLAQSDLQKWFLEGRDNSRPMALDTKAWDVLLTALGKKHNCLLDERPRAIMAARLCERMPTAARELLKDDFAHGGHAFAALLLQMIGELFGAIEDVKRQTAPAGEDAVALQRLFTYVRLLGGTLTQRLDELPNRDDFRELIDRIREHAAGLDSHFNEFRVENRNDHVKTHTMVAEVLEHLSFAAPIRRAWSDSASNLTVDSPRKALEDERHRLQDELNDILRRHEPDSQETREKQRQIADVGKRLRELARWSVGTVIADRYELLQELGRGDFASVWKAIDRSRNQAVAIKILSDRGAADAESRDRFRHGARALGGMQHEFIVRLHGECSQYHEVHYYVMDYVAGGTLAELVQQRRLTIGEVARIVNEIGAALSFIHAKGCLHRDVAPDNILINASSGSAILADFDLVWDSMFPFGTRQGGWLGKLQFAAPECFAASVSPDARADVFSLAMTAVYCLNGGLPDDPRHLFLTLPRIIRSIRCIEEVHDVLLLATEQNREQRYESMQEFRGQFAHAARCKSGLDHLFVARKSLDVGRACVHLDKILLGRVITLATPVQEPNVSVDRSLVGDSWQAHLKRRMAKHYHKAHVREKYNTNDPHGVVVGDPHYDGSERLDIRFWPTDYLTVNWLRKLPARVARRKQLGLSSLLLERLLASRIKCDRLPQVLSANAVVFCEETRELVLHLRDSASRTFPACFHTLGGGFWPFEGDHGDKTLKQTVQREVREESNMSIAIPHDSPMILAREEDTGFIQLMFFPNPVNKRDLDEAEQNWEGKLVRCPFDRVEDTLCRAMSALRENRNDLPGGWVPTGLFHILAWLALGLPHAKQEHLFHGRTAFELFRKVTGVSD